MEFTVQSGRLAKASLRMTVLAAAIALSACGGGGSSDSVNNAGTVPVDTGNGTGGGTATVVDSLTISEIGIYDTSGAALSSVGVAGAVLKVKITTNDGKAVKNALVNFSSSAGELVFGNTSGAVLTDASGYAQLFFQPTSNDVSGAYTLTADASYGAYSANETLNIQVAATNIALTDLVLGSASLSSGGQTSVSLQTVDATSADPVNGVTVGFSADCGQMSPTSISSSNQGNVQSTYKATNVDGSLCAGTVNITGIVNSGSSSQSKTVSLTVASPKVTSILYPEGQSTSIGVQGSGSSSQANIKFVLYSNTTPLAGKAVKFTLTKSPIGLTIGEEGQTTWTVTTDENGEAPLVIYPGSTPGPVEIRAEVVDNPLIFALSKGITVASSRASQNGLSLSMTANNIEGWAYDGTQSTLTMRVADKFGNAVPDGTVVNFTAEGGQITSSCETAKVNGNSMCSVTFESQEFRPSDGRITVLAVVEGEKAYTDNNQNNAFDAGDVIINNIGDTFRDDDESGSYKAGEFIYPLRSGSTSACSTALSIAKQPNLANTCNDGLDAPLRTQAIMLLAGSTPYYTPTVQTRSYYEVRINSVGPTDSAGKFVMPMPGGTTVVGSVVQNSDSSECELTFSSGEGTIPSVIPTNFIALNDNKVPDLATTHGYSLKNCLAGDGLVITTTTPKGRITKTLFTLP